MIFDHFVNGTADVECTLLLKPATMTAAVAAAAATAMATTTTTTTTELQFLALFLLPIWLSFSLLSSPPVVTVTAKDAIVELSFLATHWFSTEDIAQFATRMRIGLTQYSALKLDSIQAISMCVFLPFNNSAKLSSSSDGGNNNNRALFHSDFVFYLTAISNFQQHSSKTWKSNLSSQHTQTQVHLNSCKLYSYTNTCSRGLMHSDRHIRSIQNCFQIKPLNCLPSAKPIRRYLKHTYTRTRTRTDSDNINTIEPNKPARVQVAPSESDKYIKRDRVYIA